MSEQEYRCPQCGYTREDAAIHMDHHLCEARGGPKIPDQWGEWQEHDGGECPISDIKSKRVEIEYRDGSLAVALGPTDNDFVWKHQDGLPESDIIAYRVRVKS